MDGDWLEDLFRLIRGIIFFFGNIGEEYYLKPYYIVIDYILPFAVFLYLKHKESFYLRNGYFYLVAMSLITSFFSMVLVYPLLFVVFAIAWHILSFFLLIFVNFDKYVLLRMIQDFYQSHLFDFFLSTICLVQLGIIADDYSYFMKHRRSYKKYRS